MALPMTSEDIPTDLVFKCALIQAMRELGTNTIYVDKLLITQDLGLSVLVTEANDRMQRCIKVKAPDLHIPPAVVTPEPVKAPPLLLSDKFDPHVNANLLRLYGPNAKKTALQCLFSLPCRIAIFFFVVALMTVTFASWK